MRNYGTDFSPIYIGISQQNFKANLLLGCTSAS